MEITEGKFQKTIMQYIPYHIGSETSIIKSTKPLNIHEPLNGSDKDSFADFEAPPKPGKKTSVKKIKEKLFTPVSKELNPKRKMKHLQRHKLMVLEIEMLDYIINQKAEMCMYI